MNEAYINEYLLGLRMCVCLVQIVVGRSGTEMLTNEAGEVTRYPLQSSLFFKWVSFQLFVLWELMLGFSWVYL